MILPFSVKDDPVESYPWEDEERKAFTGTFLKFQKMWSLKNEGLDILGGRTLQEFWDKSVQDYAVLSATLTDSDDPVDQYQTTITRDKTDAFIASLSSQMLVPDVQAQNPEQVMDRVVSRVGSAVLTFNFKNDGWPSESGEQKNARMLTKSCIEGTVHVLDVVTKDGLTSEMVPNEEVFVPNYWQPDIQLQPYVFRAKVNVLYDEAQQAYGDLENFKYVSKGGWIQPWYAEAPFLKDGFQGIEWDDRVTIVQVWKRATPKELEELKVAGKVAKKADRACFYNVWINDIPMFPVDNLSPYKHGFYPINKGKFCDFAKPEFYWGNSQPNKLMEDKRFIDAWKTLIRYKGKLGVLKPMISIGVPIEEEVMLPSRTTVFDEDPKLQVVPGVSDGISNSDIEIMRMAEGEIDRGSVAPQTMGQAASRKETARAATIMAAGADKMMDMVSKQWGFFVASRSMHILLASFQMLPKRSLKMIAVPDQQLTDGSTGTMEILFKDPGMLTEAQELEKSFELRAEAQKRGEPTERMQIDPDWLMNMKFFVYSDASSLLQDKSALRLQKLERDLPILTKFPEINRKELLKDYVRMNDYSDRILNAAPQQSAPVGPPPGAPPAPGGTMQDLSMAVAGEKLPSMEGEAA